MSIPRRARLDLNTSAELQIRQAIGAVEALGAHPILTDIVVGLGKLNDQLADYLESMECGEPWCKGVVGEGCTAPGGDPYPFHTVRLRAQRPLPAAPPPVVPPREPGEPWVCVDCGLVETEAATMPTCGMKRRPHIWGAPERPPAEPPQPRPRIPGEAPATPEWEAQPSGGAGVFISGKHETHGCGGLMIPMCVNCCGPHRPASTPAEAPSVAGEGMLLERAAKLFAGTRDNSLEADIEWHKQALTWLADYRADYRARSTPKESR